MGNSWLKGRPEPGPPPEHSFTNRSLDCRRALALETRRRLHPRHRLRQLAWNASSDEKFDGLGHPHFTLQLDCTAAGFLHNARCGGKGLLLRALISIERHIHDDQSRASPLGPAGSSSPVLPATSCRSRVERSPAKRQLCHTSAWQLEGREPGRSEPNRPRNLLIVQQLHFSKIYWTLQLLQILECGTADREELFPKEELRGDARPTTRRVSKSQVNAVSRKINQQEMPPRLRIEAHEIVGCDRLAI